jgi:excisionase family DNA binding protein
MTPNELRLILADALAGAADGLRGHIVRSEPEPSPERPAIGDPLPGVTEHVLKVGVVAQLLGISRGHAYVAVRDGDIPSVRIGRRLLVPTHALRALLTMSSSEQV